MNLTPQEALQAIADGKELEFKPHDTTSWETFALDDTPIFIKSIVNGYYVFRLAPEMITIGDVSFPKPVSKPLECGTEYWVTEPSNSYCTTLSSCKWADDNLDRRYLRRGLVHLSEENAIAHAKALIKLSGGNADE